MFKVARIGGFYFVVAEAHVKADWVSEEKYTLNSAMIEAHSLNNFGDEVTTIEDLRNALTTNQMELPLYAN